MARKNYDYSKAPKILNALEAGIWPAPAHVMLREVRNATGYGQTRAADALVVSVWPSRGIWFAGVEVKTSRGDWRSELKNPEKSVEIQKFCDYWWVAAAPDVVADGEIPENWGLIEVVGTKAKVIKPAPKINHEPLTQEFIASVIRNMVGTQETLRHNITREVRAELKGSTDDQAFEPKFRDLEHQFKNLKIEFDYKEEQLKKLRDQVNAFEWGTGIKVRGDFRNPKASAVYNMAAKIDAGDFSKLADQLDATSTLLKAAEVKLKALDQEPIAVEPIGVEE